MYGFSAKLTITPLNILGLLMRLMRCRYNRIPLHNILSLILRIRILNIIANFFNIVMYAGDAIPICSRFQLPFSIQIAVNFFAQLVFASVQDYFTFIVILFLVSFLLFLWCGLVICVQSCLGMIASTYIQFVQISIPVYSSVLTGRPGFRNL